MSSEPLFDPSLKKKKKVKKAVAFDELDAELDAAPTEQAEAAEDEGENETKKVQVDTKDEIDLALPADKDGSLTLKEEEPLDFSDLKKKKKKKPIAVDLEEVATPSAEPAEDTGAAVPKRDALGNTVEDESVAEEPTATAATAAVDAEFGDLKKKKKKAKKSAMDLEAFERELAGETGSGTATPSLKTTGEDGEVPDGSANPDLDLEPEGENVFEQGGDEGASSSLSKALQAAEKKAWMQPGQEGRDYEYIELLGRFYMQLYASHPSLNPSAGTGKKRFVIQPPSMHRDGNKRSVFANIAEICRKMHRQPEHVIPFIFAELGTTGSVDGSGRLVIKGRFQQKQIENVLRRYILEYVTCKTCKSPDTLLNKENRIYFLDCQTCQSRSSVSAISAGFKAQVGRRKAQQTG